MINNKRGIVTHLINISRISVIILVEDFCFGIYLIVLIV